MPRFGLLIAFVLLAASATGSGMGAPTASTARLFTPANAAPLRLTDPIVVTRDSLRLPSGCSLREVGGLLSRFTEAVNAGDQAALAGLFVTDDPPGRAQEPAGAAFRWYSVTEARSGAAQAWRHRALYDRADLLAYFSERREQNERMSLIEAEVRSSRIPRGVGLTFKVRREADDLPSWLSPFAGGKAGIDCAERAIYLWSMGQSDRDSLGQICPRPQGWKPGAPIVACSAGPNARALSPRFRVASTRVDLPADASRPLFGWALRARSQPSTEATATPSRSASPQAGHFTRTRARSRGRVFSEGAPSPGLPGPATARVTDGPRRFSSRHRGGSDFPRGLCMASISASATRALRSPST